MKDGDDASRTARSTSFCLGTIITARLKSQIHHHHYDDKLILFLFPIL